MNAAAHPSPIEGEHLPPATLTPIAEYSPIAAALGELKKQYGGMVYDCTKATQLQEALKARADLRRRRLDLETKREELKAPVLERGRLIDAEAKRISAALRELEDPIDQQIKADEQRRENERVARERAEAERVQSIQNRIAAFATFTTDAVGLPSTSIVTLMRAAETTAVDETFCEFREQAESAKAKTLSALRQLHAGALAQEEAAERARQAKIAEDERLTRERAEFERQRAEQERQQAEANARIAAENKRLAEERAKAEAEDRTRREAIEREERAARERIAEQERLARERSEAEERQRREAQAKADAEAEALRAAERAAREEEEARQQAERERLAAERREVERKAAELMDARTILTKFRKRFGAEKEFAGIVKAIDGYFKAQAAPKAAA